MPFKILMGLEYKQWDQTSCNISYVRYGKREMQKEYYSMYALSKNKVWLTHYLKC